VPKKVVLGAADIAAGRVDFTVVVGDLGADGAKSLTAVVTDIAGNPSPASAAVAFILDTVAPAAPTLNAIATDERINAAEQATAITGKAESNAKVSLTFGGTTRLLDANAQGDWSYTLKSADITAMGQGPETVTVTATDAAGNLSEQTTRSIVVDTIAPGVPTLAEAGTTDLADNIMND
jgi:hypothetical protein